ncbi:MAG: AI-2E family transporter, partial [Rhizomicrobium sp.]
MKKSEHRAFMLLVVLATIAFAWVLQPFYGTIVWGVVVAILFNPLNLRLRKAMGQRSGPASIATVLLVIVMVILPLILISASLGQQ